MKNIIICFLFITIANRTIISYANKDLFVKKCLPEYTVDTCLHALLSSVVLSNNQFYNLKKEYYSFEFNKVKNRRSLYIAAEPWNYARTTDYSGFICIKNAIFLCHGNFQEDSLFHKTGSTRNFQIKLANDEIGKWKSFNEPSLEGTLKVCKGDPIDINIYTTAKINGYSTNNTQVTFSTAKLWKKDVDN